MFASECLNASGSMDPGHKKFHSVCEGTWEISETEKMVLIGPETTCWGKLIRMQNEKYAERSFIEFSLKQSHGNVQIAARRGVLRT